MVTQPTIDTTVADFVVSRPSRSRVFQRLGIDFCCGGKISLAEACRRRGLDPSETLDVLLHEQSSAAAGPDPAKMTLSALCDHIEQNHHASLRTELPRLVQLAHKVASVHGDLHPWLRELEPLLEQFTTDLSVHMMTEEVILFPAIRRIESTGNKVGPELAAPIRVMEHEHDTAGDDLAQFRTLSHDYAIPGDACTSFRVLLDGLRELDEDMQVHVHKENNVLFPRVLGLIASNQ